MPTIIVTTLFVSVRQQILPWSQCSLPCMWWLLLLLFLLINDNIWISRVHPTSATTHGQELVETSMMHTSKLLKEWKRKNNWHDPNSHAAAWTTLVAAPELQNCFSKSDASRNEMMHWDLGGQIIWFHPEEQIWGLWAMVASTRCNPLVHFRWSTKHVSKVTFEGAIPRNTRTALTKTTWWKKRLATQCWTSDKKVDRWWKKKKQPLDIYLAKHPWMGESCSSGIHSTGSHA